MIKKAEDTEVDTAEQSAIKLRAQQQVSNALVVTDQRPANGTPLVGQLSLLKVPSMTNNTVSAFFFSFNYSLIFVIICFCSCLPYRDIVFLMDSAMEV